MDPREPALFDPFAEADESHAADGPYNALYDRPSVLDLLGDVIGLRVLDAGCGPGLYAEELVGPGADVVAFDQSPAMVRLARGRSGDREAVRVHDLSSPIAWLDDHGFDAALMALVSTTWTTAPSHSASCIEYCGPHGWLVVSTHHPTSDWLRLGGSYFSVAPKEDWHRGDRTSGTGEPLEATCAAFADAGFVIERLIEPRPIPETADRFPEDYETDSRAGVHRVLPSQVCLTEGVPEPRPSGEIRVPIREHAFGVRDQPHVGHPLPARRPRVPHGLALLPGDVPPLFLVERPALRLDAVPHVLVVRRADE